MASSFKLPGGGPRRRRMYAASLPPLIPYPKYRQCYPTVAVMLAVIASVPASPT